MSDRTGRILDSVVVGAGWAGLGLSHALKRRGLSHVVVERGRIAETWRSQRWASFHLNTPNCDTVMPGDAYVGADPYGAPSCAGFVAMLEDFAARHTLPVVTGTPVLSLRQADGLFEADFPDAMLRARTVVLASGTQNLPVRPAMLGSFPADLHQIDASEYRSAAALPPGAVLVIGGGQSGGQIADDLATAGRHVFFATSRVGRWRRMYRGRHIMHWVQATGIAHTTRAEMLAQGRIASRPLNGSLKTISLQDLSARGVVLLGRIMGCDAGALRFSGDVAENIAYGNTFSANLHARIDAWIADSGIEAPAPEDDPAETAIGRPPDPPILSLVPANAGIETVIWCTGFVGDFSWTQIPGLLDACGQPIQEANFARVPGVYVPGVPFAVNRLSGTIRTLEDEARRIADDIEHRALGLT